MKHVIKEGNLFFFSNGFGDLPKENREGYGLYFQDTRFLSHLDWQLEGIPTVPLMSKAIGGESLYRYTNKEVIQDGEVSLWRESLEITRKRWIYGGVVYENFRFVNMDTRPVESTFVMNIDADFSDMFVVRGFMHGKLGRRLETKMEPQGLVFVYKGSDDKVRFTEVRIDPAPAKMEENGRIHLPIRLAPGEECVIRFRFIPMMDGEKTEPLEEQEALRRLKQGMDDWSRVCPKVESDNPDLDAMFKTSLLDLKMLMTDVGEGELPVAGLPWFAVPFGRDSLIAAWQALLIRPELAKSVIRTMAKYQGERMDDWRDEEPGKILHEIRYGELANTNQVPFTPYYGTIDATPLFLILIAEVYRYTGDFEFVRECAGYAQKAFQWIDQYSDPDGSGYTSYKRKSEKGISNQGWKDSGNSVVHTDGRLAEAPIALSEVQGYVYMARRLWSHLYRLLGEPEWADRLAEQARQLKQRFTQDFWVEEEEFIALALDAERKPVATVTSNPGHCLMTGILEVDQAKAVAKRLVQPDMFSGWGIRTMSDRAKSYNPMSYHNGSVWPHDNSIILMGLKQLGFDREAGTVIEGLIRASKHFHEHRLPELYCGYGLMEGELVPYPVACSPQAWAAGTSFVLVQVMLGIKPDPEAKTITLDPILPEGIQRLRVRDLRLGTGTLDVTIIKNDHSVHVAVDRNTTGWSVTVHPKTLEPQLI